VIAAWAGAAAVLALLARAVYLQHRLVPRLLLRHLGADERELLDFGSGQGKNAHLLSTLEPSLRITCTDVTDRNRHFQTVRYDGRTLPFPDGAFDSTLVAYVLHHVPAADQPRLLSEIRRVTRRRVYVFEDSIETRLDRCLCLRHLGGRFTEGDFKSKTGWEAAFQAAGFRVERAQRLHRLTWPFACGCNAYVVPRVFFILTPPAAG
jgi:ubiquinone/menaquinone biosynthesis C-methylase UbiE